MIRVTRPFLPPLDEFTPFLQEIWKNGQLTNNGPFLEQFEKALAGYLGVRFISLFANGSLALLTALHALRIRGEVITTPYSFVATANALWWNNLKPVFVDIEPDTCNIHPEKIEAALTPQTSAILPVHIYGNPCRLNQIREIAEAHNLKVIYDACHTFGVTYKDEPVLNSGDLSVMSFHATKVFTTFEGGAVVSHDESLKKRIDSLRNHGFSGETSVAAPGINAKMNEFQAALGLLQLKYIDGNILKRRRIVEHYRERLSSAPGIRFMQDMPDVRHCYSSFPVFIDAKAYGLHRDELHEKLKKSDIHCRRYFYPLISQFPVYSSLESAARGKMPVAEKMTEEVICLPVYPDLSMDDVDRVIDLILRR